MTKSVGTFFKQWRKQRRFSQLQLSVELDVSSKHISFIETGKSLPSKAMILKIATFLSIPKRDINQALRLAGLASAYPELPMSDKQLKPVMDAIEQMIEHHMPYPAIVLNQNWDLVMMNQAAQALMGEIGFANQTNLIKALISDQPETSKIINWYEVVSLLLTRLQQEINLTGSSPRLKDLVEQLTQCVSQNFKNETVGANNIVIATRFALATGTHSFFSIIAQLGTVQDVTVSEYKVELLFPADELTRSFYLT